MAEVTRVPLQSIAKGSMMKFWLGVLVGAALAGAVAFFTTYEPGLWVDTTVAGEGDNPGETDVVFVDYVGTLEDGTEFDRSPADMGLPPEISAMIPQGVPMELPNVVPGFRAALLLTQKGGQYEVIIPSDQGYGSNPQPGSPIPADADLNFEVTVHEILTMEEFQQLAMQVQMAMMEAQQGAVAGEVRQAPTE